MGGNQWFVVSNYYLVYVVYGRLLTVWSDELISFLIAYVWICIR